ncbi:MAG: DUF3883 domain-containing protein [Ignavibacteriae bacterium]|nr:DUF3883 domain-containing protein [Ignavibacteriota bacterium]
MNSEVVNTLMYNRHALMSLRITGMRELQNILDLKKYIGEKGEEYVLNYEINELKKLGLSKYSKLVDQISKNNVAAGYDIISYTKEGCKKFIEVKTSLNSSVYCYMSLNEWNTAKKLGDNYYLYVVVLKPEAVIVKIINNPVFEENKLFVKEANSYKIKFKGL